jgi:hypothetical protein
VKLGAEVLAIEHCLMAMGTSRIDMQLAKSQRRPRIAEMSEHFERVVLAYEKAYHMYARCLEDLANWEIPCLR